MKWMARARKCLGFVALVGATQLHALVYEVTVDTPLPLAGASATLAFDLLSGDAPASSLTISDFIMTGGTLGDAFVIHDFDVSPAATLAGTVTLEETGSFFNEYQQQLTLGTSFTFRFSTTGTDPGAPLTPDAFSFSLLDEVGLLSLVDTDAGGALVRYEIGTSSNPELVPIIAPEGVTVATSEVTTTVPEPGVALLVLAAILAMAFGRLFKQQAACSGNMAARS